MAWERLRTERLIEKLVGDLRPQHVENRVRVRRLSAMVVLAILLLLLFLAAPYRVDLAMRLADEMFLASFASSAMVFGAGLSALWLMRAPWRSQHWLLLPLVAFGFWIAWELASIALKASREGWGAFGFESSAQCPVVIGLVGVPVFLALLSLSRVGLILWRGPVIAIAALSAFSFPATMLNLFHSLSSGAMILLWHSLAVTVYSVAASLLLLRRTPRILRDWLGL